MGDLFAPVAMKLVTDSAPGTGKIGRLVDIEAYQQTKEKGIRSRSRRRSIEPVESRQHPVLRAKGTDKNVLSNS